MSITWFCRHKKLVKKAFEGFFYYEECHGKKMFYYHSLCNRIIVSDTAQSQFSKEEFRAALYHEKCHQQHRYKLLILNELLGTLVIIFLAFEVLLSIFYFIGVFRLGIHSLTSLLATILFVGIIFIIGLIILKAYSSLLKNMEYKADEYSVHNGNSVVVFETLLEKAKQRGWKYDLDHPSIERRIKRLRQKNYS